MRQAAAILLLLLFLFNTIGYRGWFLIAMQKADQQLEMALDHQQYQEQELFTLQLPLHLPYQNSNSFERVDGEITIHGETYKYVQRQIKNDTLILQCVRHSQKIKLQQLSNAYFEKINDIAGNQVSKKVPGKTNLLEKFSNADFINDFPCTQCIVTIASPRDYTINAVANNSSDYLQQQIKPPQAAKI